MSYQIFKYRFKVIDDEQTFPWYPNVWKVVAWQEDIGDSRGYVCLWQTVYNYPKPVLSKGKIVGTGHYFDETFMHVGTAFDPSGLVWHLVVRPVEI